MTIAPIPAAPLALALALATVYAPWLFGVAAILAIAAHVLIVARDARLSDVDASWSDVAALDCDPVAVGPMVAIPARLPRPAPVAARLAFDCQFGARDAAIYCRVACTRGNRDEAMRWRDIAIGLASEAARVATETQSPHAWRWHAGAVEAARDCSERVNAAFAPRALPAAPVVRMLPARSIRRGRSGRFVRASEVTS